MPRWIKPATVLLSAALMACSTTPGEKDLLPDTGPTTREVYDRHLSGWIAPFGVPAPPATAPVPAPAPVPSSSSEILSW